MNFFDGDDSRDMILCFLLCDNCPLFETLFQF